MAFEDSEEYTDAQLLAHVRKAKVAVALGGQSYTVGGKTFTRASLRDLNALEAEITARIDADADESGGGIALVRYGDRV